MAIQQHVFTGEDISHQAEQFQGPLQFADVDSGRGDRQLGTGLYAPQTDIYNRADRRDDYRVMYVFLIGKLQEAVGQTLPRCYFNNKAPPLTAFLVPALRARLIKFLI